MENPAKVKITVYRGMIEEIISEVAIEVQIVDKDLFGDVDEDEEKESLDTTVYEPQEVNFTTYEHLLEDLGRLEE